MLLVVVKYFTILKIKPIETDIEEDKGILSIYKEFLEIEYGEDADFETTVMDYPFNF